METIYRRRSPQPLVPVASEVINDVVKTLNPGYNSPKTKAIETCVCDYIRSVLLEVEKNNPEFKVSELLKVGSYNEGTKICVPDEFDFLAVVEGLSKDGVIDVVKVEPTESRPYTEGLVNVRVASAHMHEWGKYVHRSYLRCFQKSDKGIAYNQHETFGTAVIKAISDMVTKDGRKTLRHQNLTIDVIGDYPQFHSSVLETGAIKLKSAEVEHPNVLLTFITENSKVTADLCPAIRYKTIQNCFDASLAASEKLAEFVLSRGTILLVGRLNNDFRITFTETEVDYMRNKIQTPHKVLYMYFKYVNNLFSERMGVFSSYAFKTVCIHHDLACKAENKPLSVCFKEIVCMLHRFVSEKHLPSVFNANLNILHSTLSTQEIYMYRRHILTGLMKIHKITLHPDNDDQHKLKVSEIVKETISRFEDELFPCKKA